MVTQTKQHIRRTVPLRVKLSPDMAARLNNIASLRGLTAATFGALAVGEYVERAEREVSAAIAAAGWRKLEPSEVGSDEVETGPR
jgi:predicted transcriptional regulator